MSDPFATWRRATGRTGVRGDYSDGHPHPHKKIAEEYAKSHRPLTHAAKFAANHPGGNAKNYVRERNARPEITYNTDPSAVSWTLNTQPVPYVPPARDVSPQRLEGTWSYSLSPRNSPRENRSSILRSCRMEAEAELKLEMHHTEVAPAATTMSLSCTPGLPFYVERKPKRQVAHNRSSHLRATRGGADRRWHEKPPEMMVRTSRRGVQNLDVRKWIDNIQGLRSPRDYFEYRMAPQRRWVKQ
jgi:hypothetical protein